MSKIFYYFLIFIEKVTSLLKTIAFSSLVEGEEGVKFFRGSTVVNIRGERKSIKIGKYTYIRGELLTFRHGGKITIGNYSYIGEMSRVWSASSISIGNRVLIAHNVNIHDNNAHPIDPVLRHEQYREIITSGHLKEDQTPEREAHYYRGRCLDRI